MVSLLSYLSATCSAFHSLVYNCYTLGPLLTNLLEWKSIYGHLITSGKGKVRVMESTHAH